MKSKSAVHRLFLLPLLALIDASIASACNCHKTADAMPVAAATAPTSTADAPKKHPLKGVVTDVLPAQSALMVKHETIPGVMKAMTMMFTVDPAVLKRVNKGDTITALMSHADGEWRLEEVQVVRTTPST